MACLFPKRSVIQLHHLDVLLKCIMDSGGPAWFSSSFTEDTQCYFNLPTWTPCIGNESISLPQRLWRDTFINIQIKRRARRVCVCVGV